MLGNRILKSILSEGSFLSLFCFSVLVVLDQLIKYLVFKSFFIYNFFTHFSIYPFKNFQFAFSLPVPVWLMYFIYFLVFYFLFKYIKQNWQRILIRERIGWLLILSGGLSNVFERLFFGYVKDYINILFGYFNLADVYIVIGVLLIVSNTIFKDRSSENIS